MTAPGSSSGPQPFDDFPKFRGASVGVVLRWLRDPTHGFSDDHPGGLGQPRYTPSGFNVNEAGSHIFYRSLIDRPFTDSKGRAVIEAVRIDARGHAVDYQDADYEYELVNPKTGKKVTAKVAYARPRHMHKELVPRDIMGQYVDPTQAMPDDLKKKLYTCDKYDDAGVLITGPGPTEDEATKKKKQGEALAAAHIWLKP